MDEKICIGCNCSEEIGHAEDCGHIDCAQTANCFQKKGENAVHVQVSREATINAIVEASRKPLPEIVETIRKKHKETGKLYSLYGMPFNFNPADFETVSVGFVYRDKNGTTYGVIAKTKEELIRRWAEAQDSNARDFRSHLEPMDDQALTRQAAYWLNR